MYKYVLALILVVTLLVPAGVAVAVETPTASSASYVETLLIRQIELLQQMIAMLQKSTATVSDPVTTTTFDIEDVEVEATKETAKIEWRTTLPAESRLVLRTGETTKVYESLLDDGTRHRVEPDGLSPSIEYHYEIVAKTRSGQYDDLFGSFTAEREFVVRKGEWEDDCWKLIIEDTAGRPAKDKEVSIRGTRDSGGGRALTPQVRDISDGRGEVEYCYAADTFTIRDIEAGETLRVIN